MILFSHFKIELKGNIKKVILNVLKLKGFKLVSQKRFWLAWYLRSAFNARLLFTFCRFFWCVCLLKSLNLALHLVLDTSQQLCHPAPFCTGLLTRPSPSFRLIGRSLAHLSCSNSDPSLSAALGLSTFNLGEIFLIYKVFHFIALACRPSSSPPSFRSPPDALEALSTFHWLRLWYHVTKSAQIAQLIYKFLGRVPAM